MSTCPECQNTVSTRNKVACPTCLAFMDALAPSGMSDMGAAIKVAQKLNVCVLWCAWCHSYLGWRAGEGVSHGCCRECREKMMASLK